MNLKEQVRQFMEKAGQELPKSSMIPSGKTVRLRARLILEEAFEFLEAIAASPKDMSDATDLKRMALGLVSRVQVHVNLVEAADALADIDYAVEGTRLVFGIDGEPIAAEVHRTLMLKLNGLIDEHGKRFKPAGWTLPNIEDLLMAQGWPGDPVDLPQDTKVIRELDKAARPLEGDSTERNFARRYQSLPRELPDHLVAPLARWVDDLYASHRKALRELEERNGALQLLGRFEYSDDYNVQYAFCTVCKHCRPEHTVDGSGTLSRVPGKPRART